ncbi:MAG: pyridoxal phosphate-dependent aminotransferase [Clostridia bacterium]|nr:pyridoxal phosphate-dependent aminotransferase [Clostridia bacterium]
MISEKMLALGKKSSAIREIFEYGKKRKAEIGEENVFDFSLGNPSVPAPPVVNETIKKLVEEEDPVLLHGYTSAPGDMATRCAIAEYLAKTYGTDDTADNIYMTVGAAASLTVTLGALVCEGDEVIVLAPYFPEYRVFAENAGALLREVPCRAGDFQVDAEALATAVNAHTKAVIINSPNNPTGVVFSEESIKALAALLSAKEKEYGHPIYIISDEPYRELVYGGVTVPYTANYYDNTISCYSFSKSLSLPGERIGYICVSKKCEDWRELFFAVCGAGRALGFVCAPSLMQKVVTHCLGKTADTSIYDRNRTLLYRELTSYGYECVAPDGAFYMFVKAFCESAAEFCEVAKKHELLLVPSDSFGVTGYVRISYCVTTEQIERALPAFRALAEDFGKI